VIKRERTQITLKSSFLPLQAGVIATMDPEHEKYQSYLQMAERKETLVYNHGSEDRLH
jgi:hypothetical protein